MGKYIVALTSAGSTGKTCVMQNVWKTFVSYPGAEITILKKGIYDIIGSIRIKSEKKTFRVFINSKGDTPPEIIYGLSEFISIECDILICACHSERTLINAINKLSAKDPKAAKVLSGCEIINFGHFCHYRERVALSKLNMAQSDHGKVDEVALNELTARYIVELTEKLLNQ